jgi:hypothetical protein
LFDQKKVILKIENCGKFDIEKALNFQKAIRLWNEIVTRNFFNWIWNGSKIICHFSEKKLIYCSHSNLHSESFEFEIWHKPIKLI